MIVLFYLLISIKHLIWWFLILFGKLLNCLVFWKQLEHCIGGVIVLSNLLMVPQKDLIFIVVPFSLALNGGGRFLSPSSPLSSLLCSLVSWETLSALLSKLKYYGLTGLLMQLTLSKLGFRGTWLPWRNVRSGLYDGAWERWRIVCLAALSVEDIDIYLFGTMITGILLIGLGFALGYRRIQKTGTAVQSPTRLPVWLKLWEERSALSTETIIAIWILPRRSSRLYKGKLIKMETKIDKNGQRVACKNWNVYSPQRQYNLIFFWLPYSGLGKAVAGIYPGSAMQWGALAFLPHPTDITDIAPPPDHSPLFASMWRIIKNLEPLNLGIRQGCPLSPFLLVLVTQVLASHLKINQFNGMTCSFRCTI